VASSCRRSSRGNGPASSFSKKRRRWPRPDGVALAGQHFGQRAQRIVQQGFELAADMPRQHRRAAAAGDRHLQQAALHHRRRMEAAQFRIVDHVGQYPARSGGVVDLPVDRAVVGRGDHQPRFVQPFLVEGAGVPADAACLKPAPESLAQVRRAHLRQGAGVQQRLDLAFGYCTPANHQHGPVAQVGEQGKERSGHGHGIKGG